MESALSSPIRLIAGSREFFKLKFCHAHQGVHVSAAQTSDRWPRAARSRRSASSRRALGHLLMSLFGSVNLSASCP
eukprot:5161566-Heterocapsa_arctica.AAC.1